MSLPLHLWARTVTAICLWTFAGGPDPAQASAGPTPDCGQAFDHGHGLWLSVLRTSVHDGSVAYGRIRSAGQAALDAYLRQLESVCPSVYSTWSRPQQLAYWINVYNAYTVRLIVDHHPVKSIRSIGLLPMAAFRTRFIRVRANGASTLSLNDVEHEILRKRFGDARIHFAIVCASKGCPSLASSPYQAAELDEQLQMAARNFLGDEGKNHFDLQRRVLHLSSIFMWFRQDFEKAAGDLVEFVKRHAPQKLAAQLAATPPIQVTFQPYDWSLNGT
jgi:Protein of unknown function, DUF547